MPYIYSLEIKRKRQKVQQLPPVLMNSNLAARFARNTLYEGKSLPAQEEIHIVFLDKKNIVKGYKKISVGGLDAAYLDIKLCAILAININAHSVVLVHNHPNGDCRPSQGDITMTDRLRKALNAVDISLLDHIVLSDENFFSFQEEIKKKY